MITFPFNENRLSFIVADNLLVGQAFTNPKSDRSLLSCLKVTQCSTSKIADAPLYKSCSLPIQVLKTGPLPAPSKCKSGRFNDCGHSSTHRTTLWRWWSGSSRLRTPPGRPGPRSSSKRSRQLLMRLPQRPIRQIARDLGVSHTTVNAYVKEDLKCRYYRRQASQILTEKTKNLRLNKSFRLLTWTRWTTSFGHTSRTSPTWLPTTPKPAWSPPSAEYSPSIRRTHAGACGKDMLPVPDPYRDIDWGWMQLHWINVSSTI